MRQFKEITPIKVFTDKQEKQSNIISNEILLKGLRYNMYLRNLIKLLWTKEERLPPTFDNDGLNEN
jgi:hypothetical protein